jgi:hypothetical protein
VTYDNVERFLKLINGDGVGRLCDVLTNIVSKRFRLFIHKNHAMQFFSLTMHIENHLQKLKAS